VAAIRVILIVLHLKLEDEGEDARQSLCRDPPKTLPSPHFKPRNPKSAPYPHQTKPQTLHQTPNPKPHPPQKTKPPLVRLQLQDPETLQGIESSHRMLCRDVHTESSVAQDVHKDRCIERAGVGVGCTSSHNTFRS
jgi:hypothetical protein